MFGVKHCLHGNALDAGTGCCVHAEIGHTAALGQQPCGDDERPADHVGCARRHAAHGLEFSGALFEARAQLLGTAAGVLGLQTGLLACAHVNVQPDGAV